MKLCRLKDNHTDLISHINCSAWFKSKQFDNTWAQQLNKLSKRRKKMRLSRSIRKKMIVYLHLFHVFYFKRCLICCLFCGFYHILSHTKIDTLNGAQSEKKKKKTEMFVYSWKGKNPKNWVVKTTSGQEDILPLKSKSSVKISPMRLKPKTHHEESNIFYSDMCVCRAYQLAHVFACAHQEMVRFFSAIHISVCNAHSVVWSGALFRLSSNVGYLRKIKVHSMSDRLFE